MESGDDELESSFMDRSPFTSPSEGKGSIGRIQEYEEDGKQPARVTPKFEMADGMVEEMKEQALNKLGSKGEVNEGSKIGSKGEDNEGK